MKEFVAQILILLTEYGYGAVFAGVLLDTVGVPLAGELTLLIAGGLVANGSLGWAPVVLVASVSALFSDAVWYGIGRLGAMRLVHVYCRLSFGSVACLSRTEQMLARFGPRSLIVSRFVPGFRTFAAPISGISRVLLPRFLFYDGIGALLWSSVVVSTGMLLRNRLNSIVEQTESTRSVMPVLASLLLALFIVMKIWVRIRHGRAEIKVNNASPGDTLSIRDSSGVSGILPCIEETLK